LSQLAFGMNVFVTGASAGIGRALCEEFVRHGDVVWGVARREEALVALAAHLGDARFRHSRCDVTDETEVRRVADRLEQEGFVPDVVVLNAGLYRADLDEWYHHREGLPVLLTNVAGALTWVDKLMAPMVRRGGGQFIAISSIAALRPDRASCTYPASKAALSLVFRGLRLRYGNGPVRFKTVHLGPIATAIVPRYGKERGPGYVATAEDTARFMRRVIAADRVDFYYPRATTWPVRLTRWLPDRTADRLIGWFRR
jgi:NAD(P)-dependent dehydrogenase (short-subunit alcohol dehydrogenase family)